MHMLQRNPCNANQLAKILHMDYKAVQHHLRNLEKNNMISKVGEKYSVVYFVSQLFVENHDVFDEILEKLNMHLA